MKQYHGTYTIEIDGKRAQVQVHSIGSVIEITPMPTRIKANLALAERPKAGSMRGDVLVINTAVDERAR